MARRRRPVVWWTLLATAVLALAGVAAACSPVRLYESGRLLADIAAPPEVADGEPANRSEIAYPTATGPTPAHLYLPPGAADIAAAPAAILLVPGLAPLGRDDPRLVPFALALAHAGFAVMVPEIAGFRAQRIGPGDVGVLAEAMGALRNLAPAPKPVGIAAISYAAGPTLLATMTPQARGAADFVLAVGAYYDIAEVLAFFTTGYYRDAPDAPWQRGTPNPWGEWVFLRANLDRVADLRDRTALAAMAERRLDDLAAPIDDLAVGLGPEGSAVYALLANDDPDRVPGLAAALPRALRTDMAALDLAGRDLAAAPPRILLIHGRDDPIIPSTESAALAAALPPEHARLVLIDSLSHAEMGPADWLDLLRLWRATYTLLAWRDGA